MHDVMTDRLQVGRVGRYRGRRRVRLLTGHSAVARYGEALVDDNQIRICSTDADSTRPDWLRSASSAPSSGAPPSLLSQPDPVDDTVSIELTRLGPAPGRHSPLRFEEPQ